MLRRATLTMVKTVFYIADTDFHHGESLLQPHEVILRFFSFYCWGHRELE